LDARFEQLTNWAEHALHRTELDISPASSDASFRRYFRVRYDDESFIIMDAPPDKENSHPFVEIAGYLQKMGVNAPRVLSQDFAAGFFLLSDLGQVQYLDVLCNKNVDQLYQDALKTLQLIQLNGNDYVSQLPPYDDKLLHNEMMLFHDWYLGRHLNIKLSEQQQAVFIDTQQLLIESARQQPQVFVHRDYHSRNLMYLQGSQHNPGVLDFQDAVYGPLTYDLVSLLRDCYITWPSQKVKQWVIDYLRDLNAAGMYTEINADQFIRWFDWMGVQRHLKASGIFARLNYRDNKPGYLNDIPRTLTYVLQVTGKYSELAAFNRLLHVLDIPEIVGKS
jgi:aminoglycoside/choline kinase family phosphotransferase